MSRRAARARPSHMRSVCAAVPRPGIPQMWGSGRSGRPIGTGYLSSPALPSVTGMTESVHLCTAGSGVEYAAPDATVTVKIGAEHTGGQYELFEIDAPRADAAPPHAESWSKAFYVLQGRILVQAGDRGYDLGPGAAISIPAGTLNTFSVLTPAAKFLTISQT